MITDIINYRKKRFQECLEYGNVFFRYNPIYSCAKYPFMFKDDVKAGVYLVREFELDTIQYNSPYVRAAGLINKKSLFPKRDSRTIATYYSLDDLVSNGWVADFDVQHEVDSYI